MVQIPGFSSVKSVEIKEISARLSNEIKLHMFVFALLAICLEILSVFQKLPEGLEKTPFLWAALGFFFFYSLLSNLFRLFVEGRAGAIFAVLPAIVLFFLLKDIEAIPYLSLGVMVSAFLRLILDLLTRLDAVINFGCLVLLIVAVTLFFGAAAFHDGTKTDTILFVFLIVLCLSTVQSYVLERKKSGYPFFFFVILAALLFIMPVKATPIDWSPLAATGKRISERAFEAYYSVSYYFSNLLKREGYTAGYTALGTSGGNVTSIDRTQLILKPDKKPYFALYMSGGIGEEYSQLVEFANFLHANDISSDYASVFSQRADISVEYVYLNTKDEIAPINTAMLKSKGERIGSGSSLFSHKKGYSIDATYLDIDYGSSYLTDLFMDGSKPQGTSFMSYEECCNYVYELYGINLSEVVNEDEYKTLNTLIQNAESMDFSSENNSNSFLSEYLSTDGASSRMASLSAELTGNLSEDFLKCKAIESYLRQYSYTTSNISNSNMEADISSAPGMSQVADAFLFETGSGYCVHYTSAMVMLLRLSGIPARACSGYRYVFPQKEQPSYKVNGGYAHIWPEAYLKGIGWVPFEPTSAFLVAEDRSWNRKPKKIVVKDETSKALPDTSLMIPEIPELPETLQENEEEKENLLLFMKLTKIIIPVVLSIVLLILIIIFSKKIIREIRYNFASPEQKLVMDVEQIKRIIKKSSANDFTDRGLLMDYIDFVPESEKESIRKVFSIYYRLKYSLVPSISTEELSVTQELRKRLSSSYHS